MAFANTRTRYGGVAKTFHWLTALLIVTIIPLGIIAHDLPFDTSEELARKAWLFSLHKTLGVTVFFVALARIAWALGQTKPAALHPDRKAETLLAETVHWLLYGSLVIVPLTGWIHHAATTGFAPIWWPFGQSLPFVPKDEALAGTFAALHMIFERVLAVSIALHIAGALKHHFVDRDATLRRMWFGRTEADGPRAAHRRALPLAFALVAWAAALGVGSALGLFQQHASAMPVAALEEVSSDWQVQDGTLGLTIRQFGSEVSGSFEDWTAVIAFEPVDGTGPAGKVDVTISIGSLSLGSVKDQAMGPDFFDAEDFPTATFTAEIFRVADGYEARGTLRIKSTEVPLTLPFQLRLVDDLAEMEGRAKLDRRTFGIGDGVTDEGQLAFPVDIMVKLTATRTE